MSGTWLGVVPTPRPIERGGSTPRGVSIKLISWYKCYLHSSMKKEAEE
jgi:hypothetical protein